MSLAESLRDDLQAGRQRLARAEVASERFGRITRVDGLSILARGPRLAVGDECRIEDERGRLLTLAEVIGLNDEKVLVMPVDHVRGIRCGHRIVASSRASTLPVGPELLGRVVDPEGRPLDGRPLDASERRSVHAAPVPAMQRRRIATPMKTGVRAIDTLVTLGHGQRIGIFAGAGVGKSRLLGGIARHSRDDVVVVALVGERNREVRDFIENELTLGAGLERAVVVVATSDEPPLRRVRCALAATTIAESFRDSGHHVTLLMDSLTRVAMAQREIGLAAGEPPVAKGYTPSVFALMPRLLERAGSAEGRGSITGIYSIFVEGDDLDEPVSDAARAILDGHIVLARRLAERSHYPAIDVLASNSRVMRDVVSPEHEDAAGAMRRALAQLRDASDLISIGAYKEGSDPELDRAIEAREAMERFLRQDLHQAADFEESRGALLEIARSVRGG